MPLHCRITCSKFSVSVRLYLWLIPTHSRPSFVQPSDYFHWLWCFLPSLRPITWQIKEHYPSFQPSNYFHWPWCLLLSIRPITWTMFPFNFLKSCFCYQQTFTDYFSFLQYLVCTRFAHPSYFLLSCDSLVHVHPLPYSTKALTHTLLWLLYLSAFHFSACS